jgi:hypothetical protein
LGFADTTGFKNCGLRLSGGVLRKLGGSNGCNHRESSEEKPNPSDRRGLSGRLRSFGSSIRSLPLSAKVGLAVILALLAWASGYVGFGRFLNGGRRAWSGLGYGALGIGLLGLAIVPLWWAGG